MGIPKGGFRGGKQHIVFFGKDGEPTTSKPLTSEQRKAMRKQKKASRQRRGK